MTDPHRDPASDSSSASVLVFRTGWASAERAAGRGPAAADAGSRS